MTRQITKLHFVVPVVAVLGIALAFRSVGDAAGGGGEPAEPPPPANTAEAAILLRVGLGAEALAAAGLTANETSETVSDALAAHDSAIPSLATLDSTYATSKSDCESLERKVRSGQASQAEVTQCMALKTTAGAAKTTRQDCLDSIFEAGIADLSAGKQATLTTIRNNASWRLETQYLAKNHTEQGWVDLREALDAVRIADNGGLDPVDQATLDLLSAEDADQTVSTAKASLDAGIASVQTAWNSAVTE